MFESLKGAVVIVGLFFIFSCTSDTREHPEITPLARYQYTQLHLGVQVRIVLYAEKEDQAISAAKEAYTKIATLEDIFSSYRAHSELNRLSTHPKDSLLVVSKPLFEVLKASLDLSEETGGSFDVTLGPLITLWRNSRENNTLPDSITIRATKQKTGWHHIKLIDSTHSVKLSRSPLQLNMGGIAKGYILDEALNTLRDYEVPIAFIEAGGDIVVGDPPPDSEGWAIDVPGAPSSDPLARRASALHNAAISTSGDTEQFVVIDGQRYSHVIDPATGLGTTHRTMATVIADNGITSDSYATALTVMSPESRDEFLTNHPRVIAFIQTVEE